LGEELAVRGAPADVLGAPQRPETQRFLHRLLDAGRLQRAQHRRNLARRRA
jgi:hypothetical protein